MNILVINGPNLNLLGKRETHLYGLKSYQSLVKELEVYSFQKKIKIKCFQSNHEGEIIDIIQDSVLNYQAIIINAGAFTHTSIAILDALQAISLPTVEVHLTDISNREEFRKYSYISLYAEKVFMGEGFLGYFKAIDYILEHHYDCY